MVAVRRLVCGCGSGEAVSVPAHLTFQSKASITTTCPTSPAAAAALPPPLLLPLLLPPPLWGASRACRSACRALKSSGPLTRTSRPTGSCTPRDNEVWNSQPSLTLPDPSRLSQTLPDPSRLFQTLPDPSRLFQTLPDPSRPFQA